MDHVLRLVETVDVSGIAIASMLHYEYVLVNRHLEGYESEGNIEFLKSNRRLSNIATVQIGMLKKFLMSKNVNCRTV